MKKILAALLSLGLCLGMLAAPVAADGDGLLVIAPAPGARIEVYVSISAEGELALAYEKVTVIDTDGDGALTIYDALYCAHEFYYEGGAEAGYGTSESQYGVSLDKLWGIENGGSYGYWVNNASAWSLADPVAEGDHIYAFSYADLETWSDAYSWFDCAQAETAVGQPLKLTLSAAGYDADWNPLTLPCEGAVVTADGAGFVTDAAGVAAVTFDKAGTYVVTASSDTQTLVPPVCVVTVRSFADVVDSWAAEEIEKVIAQGLFSGTGKGFEPKTSMSRAMLVTVLYRLDGQPAVSGENFFADVEEGAYYEDAVIWAAANGIVTGYDDNTFRPHQNVSREQMAAFLWRYAVSKGYDVSVGEDTNILSYADAFDVDEYAIPAMAWACGAGVITGKTVDTLAPNESATREQVAVILSRFGDIVK